MASVYYSHASVNFFAVKSDESNVIDHLMLGVLTFERFVARGLERIRLGILLLRAISCRSGRLQIDLPDLLSNFRFLRLCAD